MPGAHPSTWYGLLPASTDDPLWTAGRPDPDLTVHSRDPDEVPAALDGRAPRRQPTRPQLAAVTGTWCTGWRRPSRPGRPTRSCRPRWTEAWARVDAGAPWFSRRERRAGRADAAELRDVAGAQPGRAQGELGSSRTSRSSCRQGERTRSGCCCAGGSTGWRWIRGPAGDRRHQDRQEPGVRQGRGRGHPQLAAYQLRGARRFAIEAHATEPGGARLLYVAKANNKTGPTERSQPAAGRGGRRAVAGAGPRRGGLRRRARTTRPRRTRTATAARRGRCPLRPRAGRCRARESSQAVVSEKQCSNPVSHSRPRRRACVSPLVIANPVEPAELADALGLHRPTPEQAAVIAAPVEPALVVAGAGAGKTETMAARVVWLVANGIVTPDRVLGLTFTRKAARQLGERVRARLRRLGRVGAARPARPVRRPAVHCGRRRADRPHLPRLRRAPRRPNTACACPCSPAPGC